MGSIANANVVGYICRLCALAERTVIHLYGERACALQLIEKIHFHLNLEISPQDVRPKVICLACFAHIEQLHQVWERSFGENTEQTQKDGDDSPDADVPPNLSND